MKELTNIEQRSNQDRRQKSSTFHNFFSPKSRRRTFRRAEDCKRIIELDQYRPILLYYTLIVLGLSLLDAALTLVLLENGAVELNPMMRYYINLGPEIFVMIKYGLTALSLMIVVGLYALISVRWRTLSSLVFPFCILVFGAVVIWELYLLVKYSYV